MKQGLRLLAGLFGRQPLSATGMQAALKLAVIYPWLLLMLEWLLVGTARLGGLDALPVTPERWRRWFAAIVIALCVSGIIGAIRMGSEIERRLNARRQIGGAELVIGLAVAILGIAFAISAAVAIIGALAGSIAGAGALIVAGAVVGVGSVAVAVAGAGAGALAGALLLSGTHATGQTGAVTGLGAAAVVLALLAALGGVLCFEAIRTRERKKTGSAPAVVAQAFAALLIPAAISVSVPMWPWINDEGAHGALWAATGRPFMFLFFCGLLPVLNAVVLLGAAAVTRVCLRRRRHETPIPHALPLSAELLLAAAGVAVITALSALSLLWGLQGLGWAVDVAAIMAAPLARDQLWLPGLALGNAAPALLPLLVAAADRAQPRLAAPLAMLESLVTSGLSRVAPIGRWLEGLDLSPRRVAAAVSTMAATKAAQRRADRQPRPRIAPGIGAAPEAKTDPEADHDEQRPLFLDLHD